MLIVKATSASGVKSKIVKELGRGVGRMGREVRNYKTSGFFLSYKIQIIIKDGNNEMNYFSSQIMGERKLSHTKSNMEIESSL